MFFWSLKPNSAFDFEDICKNMFAPNFTLLIVNAWLINYTGIYRIFGDLKFVTDLGVLGDAESKNRIRFCPSGQDQPLEGIRFAAFRKILKNLTKSFKSYLPPFLTWKQIL